MSEPNTQLMQSRAADDANSPSSEKARSFEDRLDEVRSRVVAADESDGGCNMGWGWGN